MNPSVAAYACFTGNSEPAPEPVLWHLGDITLTCEGCSMPSKALLTANGNLAVHNGVGPEIDGFTLTHVPTGMRITTLRQWHQAIAAGEEFARRVPPEALGLAEISFVTDFLRPVYRSLRNKR